MKRKQKASSREWFFGWSGRTTFLFSALFILVVCFVDKYHEGSAWIPTYAQHVLVKIGRAHV